MPERGSEGRRWNATVDQWLKGQREHGGKIQIPIPSKPELNKELYYPTKLDSFGYIKEIRQGSPNGYISFALAIVEKNGWRWLLKMKLESEYPQRLYVEPRASE